MRRASDLSDSLHYPGDRQPLMDAIECGIVKLPRVPVADNIPGSDVPKFRNLWEHIGRRMPRKGRGKAAGLDPLSLPVELQTALQALYGHYEKQFELWQKAGIEVPPCFIVVCNNTSTSKLVYDYVSGFLRDNPDGSKTLVNGRLALLRNYHEDGTALGRPRTLLIDSEQLESGEGLGRNFRDPRRQRDRAFPPRGRRPHRRPPAGRKPLRPRPAARGHEHRRQGRTARRLDPLRRLRLHADRGLGRQHRHARSGGSRLRHPIAMRAGGGPRAAPAIL